MYRITITDLNILLCIVLVCTNATHGGWHEVGGWFSAACGWVCCKIEEMNNA